MSSQSTNNNSKLLAIGAAVLVTGVILVLLILSRGDDDQAAPSEVVTPSEQASEPTASAQSPVVTEPLTPAQVAVARLPQPLEVPDGHEALAIRVNFIRGVASVPTAGDHIKVYRLANGLEEQSQVVLSDVEVLGLIGPLPQTNDGEITFLLAVEPGDVGPLMELSNTFEPQVNEIEGHTNELWFTLLPSAEDEAEPDQ